MGVTGGYTDRMLASGQYEVRFFENGYTTEAFAIASAFKRCAELTMQSGHQYLNILDAGFEPSTKWWKPRPFRAVIEVTNSPKGTSFSAKELLRAADADPETLVLRYTKFAILILKHDGATPFCPPPLPLLSLATIDGQTPRSHGKGIPKIDHILSPGVHSLEIEGYGGEVSGRVLISLDARTNGYYTIEGQLSGDFLAVWIEDSQSAQQEFGKRPQLPREPSKRRTWFGWYMQ